MVDELFVECLNFNCTSFPADWSTKVHSFVFYVYFLFRLVFTILFTSILLKFFADSYFILVFSFGSQNISSLGWYEIKHEWAGRANGNWTRCYFRFLGPRFVFQSCQGSLFNQNHDTNCQLTSYTKQNHQICQIVRIFLYMYCIVASRNTCYYSRNPLWGGVTNWDMLLNETC